jgi:hypothetical protein
MNLGVNYVERMIEENELYIYKFKSLKSYGVTLCLSSIYNCTIWDGLHFVSRIF